MSAPDTLIIVDEPGRAAGRINVDASPWAFVYIAGDSLGITPMPLVASPGTYTITLRHPDFPPFETLVDVAPNRETPVYVSLWALVGRLELDVLAGTRVFIDGEYREETPLLRPILVKPGAHELTLVHPDRGRLETNFEVTAGESKQLAFDLPR